MLKGAIAIVEDTDAVPEFGVFFRAVEMEESVLIGIISRLEFILHQKAMSEGAPYVAVLVVDQDSPIEILDSLFIKITCQMCY